MTPEEAQIVIGNIPIKPEVLDDCYDITEYQEAKTMAIKALEQTRWIPRSEKLPEKNVEVLATTEWGAITIAEMYSANDWFIHEGTTNAETDEITAWMPLPEQYKESEEECR